MKQAHVLYSGRVQGVGFRFSALSWAQELDICGWVKNLPDGKVELLARGQEEKLDKFLKNIASDFSRYIHDTKVEFSQVDSSELKGFKVEF